MTDVPFDKEKFLNSCLCGCSKDKQSILYGIEKYRESDPMMVRYLEYYRDRLWHDQVMDDKYRQMRIDLGEVSLAKKTAEALRAVADKLEERGSHFMTYCELPNIPIFSDEFSTRINVVLLAGPVGG